MVLKELNFNSFSLWEGVVILNELILSFHFGRVWWSRKKSFLTVSHFGRV